MRPLLTREKARSSLIKNNFYYSLRLMKRVMPSSRLTCCKASIETPGSLVSTIDRAHPRFVHTSVATIRVPSATIASAGNVWLLIASDRPLRSDSTHFIAEYPHVTTEFRSEHVSAPKAVLAAALAPWQHCCPSPEHSHMHCLQKPLSNGRLPKWRECTEGMRECWNVARRT